MNNPHYVTHQEAEKRTCPMKHGDWGSAAIYCTGSVCMAWRWSNGKIVEKGSIAYMAGERSELQTHGYCGMVRS